MINETHLPVPGDCFLDGKPMPVTKEIITAFRHETAHEEVMSDPKMKAALTESRDRRLKVKRLTIAKREARDRMEDLIDGFQTRDADYIDRLMLAVQNYAAARKALEDATALPAVNMVSRETLQEQLARKHPNVTSTLSPEGITHIKVHQAKKTA